MKQNKTIGIDTLQEKLNKKESVFILDVRPSDQRAEWHIAESAHVDAYKRLNDGDNSVLDEVDIPENTAVVTVCAAGRTSLIASEALRKKGIQAYSLEGGMKAWNYAWNTAEVKFGDAFKVIQVRRAAKGCLSYIAGSGNEAIVIDASLNPDVYLKLAQDNGWRIRYVMDTHIHADYISRTRELAKASGANHIFMDKSKVDFEFTPVAAGDHLKFGSASLQVIHTPGHTWESTTFKIDDLVIFTGDTLFIDGVGRPDLKAEQEEAVQKAKSLYNSLKLLLSLSPSTLVLPAHTSKTVSFDNKVIGEAISKVKEKVDLSRLGESQFIEYTLSKMPPAPPNYLTIASLNKQGSYEGHQLADLEAGGNHCAIV
jgi:glyoxylase-like metal-dependent hydrolase (beta-lactamase superfamily II)/rhodanese-related sulfurtransferase